MPFLKLSLLPAVRQASPACLLYTTSFLSMMHFTGDEPKLRSRPREAGDAAVLAFVSGALQILQTCHFLLQTKQLQIDRLPGRLGAPTNLEYVT